MASLDIELGDELIEGLRRLAVRHYGDSGQASVDRVVESALAMRLFSMELTEGGGNDIEEPIPSWEFGDRQPRAALPAEIRDLLFKRS